MSKKHTIMYGLLILMAAAAGIGTNIAKIDYWQNKFDYQNTINAQQTIQIEELKKEIRILQTDIYTLRFGFEGEQDEETDNSR